MFDTLLRGRFPVCALPDSIPRQTRKLYLETIEERVVCSVVAEAEPNNTFATAQALTTKSPFTINAAKSATSDVDFYSVPLTAGGVVKLNVSVKNPTAPQTEQFDPVVGLFDPAGQLVASNDDSGTGGRWAAGLTYVVDQTGDWRVAVSDYPDLSFTGTATPGDGFGTDTGNYTLSITPGTADIKVKDAAFVGNLSTVGYHYDTNPASFKGSFEVGLYRSSNSVFDAADQLVQKITAQANGSAASTYGQFNLPTALTPDPARPYILVVADPDKKIRESAEGDNVKSVVLPVVKVTITGGVTLKTAPMGAAETPVANVVAGDLMTKLKFFPTVTPAAGKVDFYKIQRRPYGGGAWTTVADVINPAPPPSIVQRLAGDFEYRAIVTIKGIDFTTPDSKLTPEKTRFPSHSSIKANATVKAATAAAWKETLDFTSLNNNLRREQGFWIQLNTATGAYSVTPTVYGPAVDVNALNGEVTLVTRAADLPAGDGQSAIYTVASFHTHTPTRYRPGNLARPVGPSRGDISGAGPAADDCPALVYDYVGIGSQFIEDIGEKRPLAPFGLALNAPAKIWHAVVRIGDTVYDRRSRV